MRGFNTRKAAQVAAYFARAAGGSIYVLKLVKLIYLADRKFLEKYDATIINDRFVSMDHGPVNSTTLNYINGCAEDRDNWEEFIADRADHMVALARPDLTVDDLGALSDAEVEVLDEIWAKFGRMDRFEICDWTHKHCPEWEDPRGSSYPIPFATILAHLHKDRAREIAEELEAERDLDRVFAS